jgi:hypothetical protein
LPFFIEAPFLRLSLPELLNYGWRRLSRAGHNGHQTQAFWSTLGKETTGSFEVHLKPGIYYLALSNQFSLLTDKYVVLDASLKYQELQTN